MYQCRVLTLFRATDDRSSNLIQADVTASIVFSQPSPEKLDILIFVRHFYLVGLAVKANIAKI